MLLSDRGLHWVGVGILRIQELLISKFSALLRSSAPEREFACVISPADTDGKIFIEPKDNEQV